MSIVFTHLLTCSYCGSSLQIQRTGATYYSEVFEQVQENTEGTLENSEQLLIEQRIARLDREWEMKRKRFRVLDEDGKASMPSKSATILSSIVAVIGLVLFFVVGGNSIPHTNGEFGIFIIVFVVTGVWYLISSLNKASDYETAKQKYRLQRQYLLNELNNDY